MASLVGGAVCRSVLLLLALSWPLCLGQGPTISFAKGGKFIDIPEEQPVGTVIANMEIVYFAGGSLQLEDAGSYSYVNSSDPDLDKFTLNQATGELNNAVLLDRDAPGVQTSFTLRVQFQVAADNATAMATILVSLLDVNDNPPSFTQEVYQATIAENTPSGVPFTSVLAEDPDQVQRQQVVDEVSESFVGFVYLISNGLVNYTIVGGNELGHFAINVASGNLSVAAGQSLDVDSVDFYNITVLAEDGGGLTDTANVVIDILDSNDNFPMILSPSSIEITISEDTAPGFVVIDSINATDEDMDQNAEIEFLIVSGDVTNSFTINSTTGELVVTGALDRELAPGGTLTLSIAARDHGVPPLQSTIPVVVHLTDINDSPPQFDQSTYVFSVSESARIGDNVGQVNAIDLDADENGTVRYSLVNHTHLFVIDTNTGVITTNITLDRETTPTYNLTVEAVDTPNNISFQLSSTVIVTVAVGDVNDNTPVWSQPIYTAGVLDTAVVEFEVIRVTATDRDAGINALLRYELFIPPDNDFAIDLSTGSVTVNTDLEFHTKSSYSYTLRVSDSSPVPRGAFAELNITVHTPNIHRPIFEMVSYSETVSEVLPIGATVLNVTATDPDPGLIGEIHYRIPSESVFDPAGSFTVDADTGAVIVASSLDFDFRDNVTFMVEAYDGGFPEPFTDRTNVTIFLLNSNDEPPIITVPSSTPLTVPENHAPPIQLGNLYDFTSDRDPGVGGKFNLSLVGILGDYPDSENVSFAFNSSTGILTALRVFDREDQPDGITLQIRATDFGSPTQSLINNVTVQIGDENDESPYFEDNVTATAYEFHPPGQIVFTNYTAEDDDIGSNAELEYAIFSGDTYDSFTIDSTGTLSTVKVLNKTEQRYYNLTIVAMDRGIPPLIGFGQIEVEILDANDNPPVFIEPLEAFFNESIEPGQVIYRLNATDPDEGTNAIITYYFAPNTTGNFSYIDSDTNATITRFSINSTSGELLTNDSFDREVEEIFNLTVIAVDMGLVRLTSTATLFVHLQDVNDNPPLFVNSSYTAQVVENAENGTSLLTVTATDADATAPHNEVIYSLSGNRSDELAIDPVTGEVTVDGEVDWEEGPVFTVEISATNPDELFSATADLTVFITNVNDRPPEWVRQSLHLTVLENQLIGAQVGYIEAIDPDSQDNFSYQFAPSFTSEYFALNSTGEVTTLVSFDREEKDLYQILVIAVDHDTPQQTSTMETAYITVLDKNDNTPQFVQTLFTGSISENSSIGSSILTLEATDRDIGLNSELTYSILSPNISSIFSINATTGVISTDSVLDYEAVQEYSFAVMVVDNGVPSLSSTALVNVAVIDYNDEPPLFLSSSYAATTEENIAVGTNLLQVEATDSDVGPNAVIRYYLLDMPGSDHFGIDPETGVLYTLLQLNREEYHSFNLTAVANNSLSTAVQQTTVSIFINLTDFNDQHPSFDIVQEITVQESPSYSGNVIFKLTAQDGDEGQNGTITYQLLQGNDDGYFNFSVDTGELSLAKELDYEDQNLFYLSFNATDGGIEQLSNYTTLIIHVTDRNDNAPSFSAPLYVTSITFTKPIGEEILVVTATDADSGANAALTYSIADGNEQGLFRISPNTGSVVVNQSLVSLAGQVVNISVAVSDSDFNSTATVSVHIRGSAAAPSFDALSYQANIVESSSPSQTILDLYPHTIPATPATIFEIAAGNEEGLFAMSTDGRLTADGDMIDYEKKRFYQLSVAARQGGVVYALVRVQVTDINEHPPVFPVTSFFAPLSETAVRNQPFFTVLATDRDGSSAASAISYTITSGNVGNTFRIDSATGELTLNRRLDYNVDSRQYVLNVTATNSITSPPLATSVAVEVELLDGNRHRPQFSPPLYSVTMDEDPSCENTGRLIETVAAVDEDTGSNGDILYGLLGDHHFVDFQIDRFSGNITVERCIDFERQTFYTLIAVASDRGSSSLSATAAVLVTIIDLNDNTPQWESLNYTATIPENITIGTVIINVTATDADHVDVVNHGFGNRTFNNKNGYVTYSISSGDPMKQFAIDPDTGAVSIANPLNREEIQEYTLLLNATDGGGRYNNSYLHVTLKDINTFTPNFTSDIYYADIPEDALPGTFITNVVAMDSDLLFNAVLRYSIDAGNEEGKFRINSTTGDVFLNSTIDREQRETYMLTVEATDQGAISLTGSAMLQIAVLDLNEHPPVFSKDEYVADVFENEPIGFIVLRVNTSDEDYGVNATASYSITDGNEDDLFAINPVTGEISVAGNVDFEEEDIYELVVNATDVGPAATRLSTEVNVTIMVLDRNDNQPELTEMSYELYVAENTPPMSTLLELNATDLDSDINQVINFSLSFASDPPAIGIFSIDTNTGVLSLISPLDRESKDTYSITVIVTDNGTPRLSSNASMTIFITDNNDNPPIFSAALYTGDIAENQPSSTAILQVTASDADIGLNAEIVYSISEVIQNQSECVSQCSNADLCSSVFTTDQNISQSAFVIDAFNGEIVSGEEFDREGIPQYVFVVTATDSSNETQLSGTSCVHVTILDENDNPPSFSSLVYTADLSEAAAMGSLVTTVTASDRDEGMNSKITYMIAEGAQFTIHPISGQIHSMTTFDRETQDSHTITVHAVDGGSPSLTGTAVVMVTILDENDNEPVFSQGLYEEEIVETLHVGQSVLQLSASDNDTTNNSFSVFSIISSKPADHFTINATTGLVYSTSSLDRENNSNYSLTVKVEDKDAPSLSSTAQVKITILDINDNSPIFTESSYTVSIEENLVPSESFLDVMATDTDIGDNGEVFYSITDISPSGPIVDVDSVTGELFLMSELDAEVSTAYNITVRADNGPATPQQQQDTIIVLEVLDKNDNAPEFQFPMYKTIVSEDTSVGQSVLQLRAEDADVSINSSLLTYSLPSTANTTLFAVDPSNGTIRVIGSIDRESEDEYVFTVLVTDNGVPSLSGETEVTVIITDENDNPPIFQQPEYSYEIDENQPVGTSIGRVYATDVDLQNITYLIANETDDDSLFSVDSISGEIFSAARFDREEEVMYSIIVLAVDDEERDGRTAEVAVNVTILDENDNPPLFLSQLYEEDQPENTTVGTPLLTVSATDPDEAENGSIVYSILPGNDSGFFEINNVTGEIFLTNTFDRELQDLHKIVIIATDLGSPPLNSTAEVIIYVTDFNDNIPILNQTLYTAAITENTVVGSYILSVSASDEDIDENSDIFFSLSDTFGGIFAISETSGVLRLTGAVDYELVHNYSFFVVASDDGDPQLMSSSRVIIEVLDINDNSPVFDQMLYQVSIPENSILGTPVFQVPATDRDSTSNGELRYTILSGNSDKFALGETTGVITVAGYLDRETQPVFTVDVRVVDQGTPQRTASATVNITVSDTNDHAPQFDSKQMSVTISEDIEVGSEVFGLQATDEDLGENSLLTFEILSEDSLDYFGVDNVTGKIMTESPLDFDVLPRSFSIAVLVHDNGVPQLFDTGTLLVLLTDINDNPPSLTQSRYLLNISMTTELGTPIAHLLAVDLDSRQGGGQITYSLGNESSDEVAVGETTGILRVSSSTLTGGDQSVSVDVSDGGVTVSIEVELTVQAISYADPLFSPPTFLFMVSESTQLGELIGIVTTSSVVDSLLFIDPQTHTTSSAVLGLFKIYLNGSINLIGQLDYETTPAYVINIRGQVSGGEEIFALVSIQLIDYNDNPPEFSSEEYLVTVSEDAVPGTTLLTVFTDDSDSPGPNRETQLTIVEGSGSEYFSLDPSTGVLTIAQPLDRETQSYVELVVNASNHQATPALYSTVIVAINVTDANDNSPQFGKMIYQVGISENTVVGSEIIQLIATDPDEGSNSELVYSILHQSEAGAFLIGPSNGSLFLQTSLSELDTDSLTVSVMVSDRGAPIPRTDTAMVFITTHEVNIFPPVFTQPDGYLVSILETLPIDSSVLEVSAIDPDDNSTITIFSITSGNSNSSFSISSSGLITVDSQLSFQAASFYSLTVSAEDEGIPSRVSDVAVNITIIDVNDHSPQFNVTSYQSTITENTPIGTLVTRVFATDIDAVTIQYRITLNFAVGGVNRYSINETTGEIFTAAPIDSEEGTTVELLVSAIDTGYPTQRSTSVPVIIHVLNHNDEPPHFNETHFSADAVRLLPANQYVTKVMAYDPDLLEDQLMFAIVKDSSGGMFHIDPLNATITTTRTIPEDAANFTNLTVSASDGKLNSTVLVTIRLVDEGMFCEAGGFCTTVRAILLTCSYVILNFPVCESYCASGYELGPLRRVCIAHSCIDTSLVPCNISKDCFVPNHICGGKCPDGMGVCPTTNICYPLSHNQSCDPSQTDICLSGQTLVQYANETRRCVPSSSLPPPGPSCISNGSVFCDELLTCSNLSAPHLCQLCPVGLVHCPHTSQCLTHAKLCCRVGEYFCDVLDNCISDGLQCRLPNIAPTIPADLIYLETLMLYSPSTASSSGHMIGVLLGNNNSLAVESQGEELGIAITEVSSVSQQMGEWQYALCNGPIASCRVCSNLSVPWTAVNLNASESSALFLPNTACLRFWRKAIELEGAVWMKAKVWDGNMDGYLSNSSTLVRTQAPHIGTTLPYTNTSSVSQHSTLLTVLLLPLVEPPKFSSSAGLFLPTIVEDVAIVDNLGGTVSDIASPVLVAKLPVHSTSTIPGLPSVPSHITASSYLDLIPSDVKIPYFQKVAEVNPTRLGREETTNLPGVAVSLQGMDSSAGMWQVSPSGDEHLFVFLTDLLTSPNQALLLNNSSRLRFVPRDNFHGNVALPIRAWDGVAPSSPSNVAMNDFTATVANITSFQSLSLSTAQLTQVQVEEVPDTPVIISASASLTPLPYTLQYHYQRLFTALVARDPAAMRARNRASIRDVLHGTLSINLDIHRLYPANSSHTYMSFSIVGNVYNLTEIEQLVAAKTTLLSALSFPLPITSVSQEAHYGPGSGCPAGDTTRGYPHGDQVSQLMGQVARDNDRDLLGMAVVGVAGNGEQGMWQYLRGNWTARNQTLSNTVSGLWINFPTENIQETRALLLHGNDRVRYLPKPGHFWSANSSPSLTVKAWDASIGSLEQHMTENSRININTNQFIDTLQSLHRQVGRFSTETAVLTAARQGCDNVVNSVMVHDACCVCGGDGTAGCSGCDNVASSNKVFDACDTCGGNEATCLGCDFIPYSLTTAGDCGQCVSSVDTPTGSSLATSSYPTDSFQDCAGVCFGVGLTDECGTCSGGNTTHQYNSDKDCTGRCSGLAKVDTCGYCTGPGTSFTYNQNLDCTGVCNGPFRADSCNVCQLPGPDGSITSHADCANVCFGTARLDRCTICYGGNTGLLANQTIDICGECNGGNATCVGCDGVLASQPVAVDSCGECGGNDCGCFKISSISPMRGPRTGGTSITIKGAGFFRNASSYDKSAANCGVPSSNTDGTAILPQCQFASLTSGETAIGAPAYIVDHRTIICTTASVVGHQDNPQYSLSVRIDGGPYSASIPFIYDDYAPISIIEVRPTRAPINSNTTVTFVGKGFINTADMSCLIEGFRDCVEDSPAAGYLTYPAVFLTTAAVTCSPPPSTIPCQFRLYLSLDGQMSGVIQTTNEFSTFTYAHSSPNVTSIHFSPDLTNIVVSFNQQAELVNNMPLSCAAIFTTSTLQLLGNSDANCSWSNTAQREVHVSLPASATMQVNSPIRFKNGVVQTRGQRHSFEITDMPILVSDERNAVKPVAVLAGPTSVPFCGEAMYTVGESLHPGYKGFQYQWSLYTNDATIRHFYSLVTMLKNLAPTTSTISLPTNLFLPNTEYHLQVTVVNSMGLSDRATLTLTKDSSASLQVSIPGPARYTLQHGEGIQLESRVITNNCINLNGVLTIQWRLQRVVDTRRMLLQDQQLRPDVYTNTTTLSIPSTALAANSTYVVTLTVQETSQSLTATKQVTLSILNDTLVARIHGGNKTVSTSQTIVLDSRTSSIISYHPSAATFTWQCSVLGSGAPCYNTTHDTPTAISLPQISLISLPASELKEGATYRFSLMLKQGVFSSQTSVLVEVKPSTTSAVVVEILTPTSPVIATEEVTIEALVWSQVPVSASWESVSKLGYGFLNLSQVSAGQVTYPARGTGLLPTTSFLEESIVPGRVNRVNLVLKPHVLVPELPYSFRVTARQGSTSTYSEITITAQLSPKAAVLSVQPLSGTALVSSYQLTVNQVTDSISNHPLLYQFGVQRDETLYWLTGPLRTKSVVVPLPRGGSSNMLQVVVGITGVNGGHTDVTAMATVLPNTAASTDGFYSTLLQTTLNNLSMTKNWNRALSILTASLLNMNTATSSDVGTAAVNLLSDIYYKHLPDTVAHQKSLIPTLQLLVDKLTILNKQPVVDIVNSIVQHIEMSVNANLGMVPANVPIVNGVPAYLASNRYGQERIQEQLTAEEVEALLRVWSNLITGTTATTITTGMQNLTNALCKQMVTGEQRVMATGGSLKIKAEKSAPRGAFKTTGGAIVDFGSALDSLYEDQLCPNSNIACSEVCLQSFDFTEDYFGDDFLNLHDDASAHIRAQIEGSDPSTVQLFSDIVSLDFTVPVQDRFLNIRDQAPGAVKVHIPARNIAMPNGSVSLCLYRDSTSSSSQEWQLDSIQQPRRTVFEEREYFVCSFNHLTAFAVGLLPPPVIMSPSSTPPPPSSTPTPAPSSSSVEIFMTPIVTPVPDNTGIIAAVVVILLLLAAAAVVVAGIVGLVIWRKKHSMMVKVSPLNAEVSEPATAPSKPLTPEEAKTPVRVIQLQENGERSFLGTTRILPSMRLRELRNILIEEFSDLKNKAFYLCTKELCDIEPASEQQQFVSIVYSGVVFIRHVNLNTPLTRHQFCVCGKAAQFECSSCNAQGYCSQDCQLKHWTNTHQKLCSRMSEKKRRTEVLLRRQTSSSNALPAIPEASPSQQQQQQPVSVQPQSLDQSTPSTSQQAAGVQQQLPHRATSPADWKSFLKASRGVQSPPQLPKQVSTSSVRSQPFQPATGTEQGEPKSPASKGLPPIKTPLSPSGRPPVPPTKKLPTLSIGKLASQKSTTQPATARPLFPPASRVSYASLRQTPLTTPGVAPMRQTPLFTPGVAPMLARPGMVAQTPTSFTLSPGPLSPTSAYGSSYSQLGYSQLQQAASPTYGQNQVFFRPPTLSQPPMASTIQRPAINRNMSVRSIESVDLNMSSAGVAKGKIRTEPLLEQEEESSSEEEEATAMSTDRPPSLSVRQRHSRMESRKDSSSDDTDSETDSS